MKGRIGLLSLFMFFAVCAFAQNVTITTSAPSVVEVGDKFRVQFTVNNTQNVSNFNAPDFKGFEVIYGPSTSTRSSYSVVNGHATSSSSVTYTFVIMAAVAGTYTINPATVQAGGKTVKSNTVKVKVQPLGKGSTSGSQGGIPSRQSSTPVTTGTGITTKDLFMTATASRTKVYEQEAILLTYKVYTLVNLTDLDGKLPTLDGFQIQEIPLPRTKEFSIEQYNGRNYRTVVWSQYVLYPQKSGDIEIPSITYEGTVVMRNSSLDPVVAFFNGQSGMQEMKKHLTTPRIVIHVSPLPNKPADFSGAVGKFTLSSSVSSTDVLTNDAITLKVNVNGSGNMKLIKTPFVEWPKDFETYDAKVNDNFKLSTSGLSGSKQFEYLAVPRHAGKYTVPAVKFVYFDTDTKTYKTLVSQPYTINVKKGAGNSSQAVSDFTSQHDVEELNTDIRYIKMGDANYFHTDSTFFGSWKYLTCYLLLTILAIVAAVLGKHYLALDNNSADSRKRKANKNALKKLAKAETLMKQGASGEFYDEVLKALWGYAADKLNMPKELLNKENIQTELASHGVANESIDAFINALNDCEFARYAPGDTSTNMESTYQTAVNAITQLNVN